MSRATYDRSPGRAAYSSWSRRTSASLSGLACAVAIVRSSPSCSSATVHQSANHGTAASATAASVASWSSWLESCGAGLGQEGQLGLAVRGGGLRADPVDGHRAGVDEQPQEDPLGLADLAPAGERQRHRAEHPAGGDDHRQAQDRPGALGQREQRVALGHLGAGHEHGLAGADALRAGDVRGERQRAPVLDVVLEAAAQRDQPERVALHERQRRGRSRRPPSSGGPRRSPTRPRRPRRRASRG